MNGIENVVLTQAALSGLPGMARLQIRSGCGTALGGGSRITNTSDYDIFPMKEADAASWESVRLDTIDSTIQSHRTVSVIHLDVEGHEQQALTGALRLIRKQRPAIVVETVPDVAWLEDHLFPLGYQIDSERPDGNSVFISRVL